MNNEKEKQFLEMIRLNKGLILHVCSLYANSRDDHRDLYQAIRQLPDISRVRSLGIKNINRNRLVMMAYLAVYLLMLGATIVLEIMNIGGYKGNSPMVAIHAAVLVISILISSYGIFLITRVNRTTRTDLDLMTAIRSQIRLYKVHYEVWLWMVALTVLLLTFALNTLADNDNGTYRINNPALYAAIQAGIFLFIYAMMKAAHYPLLRQLRAHLSDLESQTAEATDRNETARKKWRWWALGAMLIIMAALAITVALGILKWT